MSNCSIWTIDRSLSGATTPGQSGPGSDGNKRVLGITQSSSITRASPLDCFMSYLGHSLERGIIPLCRDTVSLFYSPSLLSVYSECASLTSGDKMTQVGLTS